MKKLTPILLLTFVNVIGFSLLIPVLPEVLITLTGENSGFLYGLLLSSYAFSQFLAAPVLGGLSDRYGRRPILLLSQLGTFLSWVIFAAAYFIPIDVTLAGVSLPLIVLFFSRITDGITGGNVAVAQAWVSDMTTSKEKTKAFGLIGATFGMGFLIGPAVGGFSVGTHISFLGTALFALLLSFVTLCFVYWGLPESLPKSKREKHTELSLFEHVNVFAKFALFRKNPVIKNLLWVRMFFSLAFVGFTTSIILLLERNYNLSPVVIGVAMSVIGIFAVINQVVILPWLDKKLGSFRSFFAGLVLSSIFLCFHSLLPLLTGEVFSAKFLLVFFFLAFFLNLGLSMVTTMFKTIIAKNTTEAEQGKAMGLDESITSFGQGVTPVFAGVLYDIMGANAFLVYGAALLLMSAKAFHRCMKSGHH